MTEWEAVPVGRVRVQLLAHGDAIVRIRDKGGQWEPETRGIWEELVKPGELVIDVGAYTGIYAIASALLGAYAMAIEPHPQNFVRLQKNVDANNVRHSVKTLQVAASSSTAEKVLRMKRLEGLSDTASLQDDGAHMIKVQAKRIDSLDHKRDLSMCVCLMKIDVEHHELPVLKGACGLIAANKPAIVVESLTEGECNLVSGYLGEFGYERKRNLDGRNWLYVADRAGNGL